MTVVSTTSPFASREQEDSPWILWCSKTPVITLKDESRTDDRSVFKKQTEVQTPPVAPIPPVAPPQPNRYNAVMARINQAARQTSGFSAWKTT